MRPSFSGSETRKVYLIAGLFSVLLSCWIAMRESVINTDGICYVLSAGEFGKSGIGAAMHLCGQAMWPFYSVLIYAFSKLSFLSTTASAFMLDGIFTLISVLSFISIVRILGGTRRVMWLAAFVILFSHQFNSVRQYIIRDHGFWAFYLMSLFFMLRFMHEGNWKNAISFSASILVATLFRVEGAIFLISLPFLAFFADSEWRERGKAFLKLNTFALLVGGALIVWLLMHPTDSLGKFGRASELVNQVSHGFVVMYQRYQHSTAMMMKYVLPTEAGRDVGIVWFVTLIGLYLINVVNNLSWAAAAVVLYAWFAGVTATFSRAGKTVLFGYLFVNLAITAGFFAERLFFSKRYLIAMSLVLLVWAPFALDKLIHEGASARQRLLGYAAMALIFISSLGVMVGAGPSKGYIREAGDWLAENVPAHAKLYSNDKQLAYYSNKFGSDIFQAMRTNRNIQAMVQGKLHEYDFAALRSGREQDDRLTIVLREMHAPVARTFTNKRGDNVTIYKIPRRTA